MAAILNNMPAGASPGDLYRYLKMVGMSDKEATEMVNDEIRRQMKNITNPYSSYSYSFGPNTYPSFSGNVNIVDPPTSTEVFEVGDEVVVTDPPMTDFTGVIGEINNNGRYYIWQDQWDGASGSIKPSTGGYLYSWSAGLEKLTMKKKKSKAIEKKMVFDPSKLDALVIEEKVREEITAVLKQYKNHDKLFDEWGLGEVIEYGRGMTFMFYGGPGTGKTWGATCIAKAMGTEMITLSAAEIQSSEPGGANRAIQEAFKEAKKTGKVIFLDECDSLIASRNDLGMVLASEVNTLLTEIEKFEGVAILATNRIEHMDEALERRISLIVEFPKPDYENRKKIWAKLLPKKMPLAKEVSIDSLATEELTGGQIKNIVLQAARVALAGECAKVELKHFEMAIARIKQSKNLMGTASRYRQGVVRDDFGVSSTTKTKLKDLFKVDDIDEDKGSDKDAGH